MAQTFTDGTAGVALSRLARARAADPDLATPADVCLFAWLCAEAARRGANPIETSLSQIFQGFTDERGTVAKVGLSQNTIKTGLTRLTQTGFLHTRVTRVLRGGGAQLEVTIGGVA